MSHQVEHYTKNTVEVQHYCKRCEKRTQHMVLGGKLGGCTVCMAKQEQEKLNQPAVEPEKQGRLF